MDEIKDERMKLPRNGAEFSIILGNSKYLEKLDVLEEFELSREIKNISGN